MTKREEKPAKKPPPRASKPPSVRRETIEVDSSWLYESDAESQENKAKAKPRKIPPSLPKMKRASKPPRRETMEVQADWLLPPASKPMVDPTRLDDDERPPPPALAKPKRKLPPPIPREEPKSTPPPKKSKRPPRD